MEKMRKRKKKNVLHGTIFHISKYIRKGADMGLNSDEKLLGRNNVSKTTSKYWEGRLYKRAYKNSTGEKINAPDWYVSFSHKGEQRPVCLQTPNKALAAKKALDAYLLLKSQGWDALWDAYKVRKSKNDEKKKEEYNEQKIITIGDFISAIKEKCTFGSNRTLSGYISALHKVAADIFDIRSGNEKYDYRNGGNKRRIEQIHAINIVQFTPIIIEDWKNKTIKLKTTSDPESNAHARSTINSTLRGCKCIFSKKILCALGFDKNFISPFAEVSLLREESHRYVTRFDAIELIRNAKDELKQKFPKSYIIFLLAIGTGLRRNEIDKLLLDQVDLERGIISIHTTPYFTPKTRDSSSEISLDRFIVDELKWFKEFSNEKLFVIESRIQPNPYAKYSHYRCNKDYKRLYDWLRQNGVNARSKLHTLRKEFGAQICREYGLYMASRALRHSSYKMTESFYVDKTAAVVPGFFKKVSQ